MKLQDLMIHSFRLYGRRNRIYLKGISERVSFLNCAIGDAQEAVRKEVGLDGIGSALARVVSRIFCIAEAYQQLPLVEVLSRKYPLSHCTYCGKLPCDCPEKQDDFTLLTQPFPEQKGWSLSEWCDGFARLYNEANKRRGIQFLINRLFKEAVELSCVIECVPEMTGTLEETEREITLELADVFAWTVAVANLLGINLEKAFLARYGNGCRKCHQTDQCSCTHFDKHQLKW